MVTPRSETNGSLHNDTGGGRAEADPVVLGCHLLDFWINICLCHSLIVEEAEDGGPPIYQACLITCIVLLLANILWHMQYESAESVTLKLGLYM